MSQAAARRWGPALRVGLGFAISAIALVAVLRQVHWDQVVAAWQAADARFLVLGALLYPWRLVFISARWQELLRLYGPTPAFRVTLRATSVGYLFNNLLPLRSGDLVRGAMVVREGVTIRAAASSVLLEKVVDLWALVAIALLAGGAFLRQEPALLRSLHWVALVAGVSLGVFLAVALSCSAEQAGAWCDRATTRTGRLLAKLARVVVESGQLCRRPGPLLITLAATAVNWGIEACFYLLVARSLGMPLTIAGALFMVSVIGLGLSVPTTAGGIGVCQYLAVAVLKVQGIGVNVAAAYSLLSYAVAFVCLNGVGLVFLVTGALRKPPANVSEGGTV